MPLDDLKKLKISTKQNLPPRRERRYNLEGKSNGQNVSKEFIQTLTNTMQSNSNSLNAKNLEQKRISPGRLPTNAQKAKSPARDTCRHIAPRDQINYDLVSHRNNNPDFGVGPQKSAPNDEIAASLLNGKNSNSAYRIINFAAQTPRSDINKKSNAIFSTSSASRNNKRAKVNRHIPLDCDRVLDAPGMRSDYYINPLDWSASENLLAVALAGTIYIWNAENGETEELDMTSICDEGAGEYISAVKFIKNSNGGPTLAVGVSTSFLYLFDVKQGKKLRKMAGHVDVINALDWNKHILTSSCKDGSIFNHDVRQRDHHVGSFLKHTAAVPGLSWSPNENFLASGSNDNLALIWDIRGATTPDSSPLHTLSSHLACVKAVAWSSRQNNVLATGGGTADRCIKIWNAVSGHETLNIETNSQVCSIIFSKNYDELRLEVGSGVEFS